MKFDSPATTNPIDQLKVVGKPTDRIDGPLKTTGTAPYAYERHDVAPNAAYGYVIGSAIAKGRIASIDIDRCEVGAGRAGHRDRPTRRSWAEPNGIPRRYSAALKSFTTTRPSRSWWLKRSSRRAPPRSSCGSSMFAPRVRSIWPRPRTPQSSPTRSLRARRIPQSAISPARSRQRPSSWTPRTRRLTRPTR